MLRAQHGALTRPRLLAGSAPAWLWFGAIALVVAGPLLANGYLTLLDFPAAPHFPALTVFPLPSSSIVGNATPLTAAQTLLRLAWVHLPDKVFLVAPVMLGGVGLFRFLRRYLDIGTVPALFGGTLFVINPFISDRFLAGQLYFVLAYALLPWALPPLLRLMRDPTRRDAVWAGLWLLAIGAIDIHVAGMYVVLVLGTAIAAFSRRSLGVGAAALLGGGLLSAYWVLPALFVPPGRGIGAADLAVYATRPAGGSVLATLASMHGFWRDEFPSATHRHPLLLLLLLVILGVVVAGVARTVAPGPHRRFLAALGAIALLGLVLAAGTSFPPTAGAFRAVFDHVSFFHVYREPQKFLALTTLGYGVFGAIGLQWLAPRKATIAGAVAVTAVIAYSYTLLWGLLGQVGLSTYPADWARADRLMARDGRGGRVLVLPWHLYAVWGFEGPHIIQNPTPFYFTRQVLSGDNVGFRRIETQSTDPFSYVVQAALARSNRIHDFGRMMAPLDVRFVAYLPGVGDAGYGFLRRQGDLRVRMRTPSIELFENRAWRGRNLHLDHVDRAPPPVDPVTGSFPPVARPFPIWRHVRPGTASSFVTTGDRCTDGWRLGGERSVCSEGAVAAFPTSGRPQVLWRPLVGATLIGYAISGLTLVLAITYLRRTRTP